MSNYTELFQSLSSIRKPTPDTYDGEFAAKEKNTRKPSVKQVARELRDAVKLLQSEYKALAAKISAEPTENKRNLLELKALNGKIDDVEKLHAPLSSLARSGTMKQNIEETNTI